MVAKTEAYMDTLGLQDENPQQNEGGEAHHHAVHVLSEACIVTFHVKQAA